jgi:hypothetical protein
MAAVEILESPLGEVLATAPRLRLVSPATFDDPSLATVVAPLRRGPSLAERRQARARVVQRRRRALAGAVIVAALTVLALPGHTLGATDGAGLSNDLAGSSVLASGESYVVQPGDTVGSIARAMNPVDPAFARRLLVKELGSSVVVPGEHVLIP